MRAAIAYLFFCFFCLNAFFYRLPGSQPQHYTLPQSIGTAQIRVVDVVTGRTVHRQQLSTQAGKADLKLDLAQFSSGCFAYTLIIDDKPVATRKMVVIK